MKNQFFGDNKDLFKYDLILQIMQTGLVEHFTFVPMLTRPEDTRHGNKADRRYARAGSVNKELVNFLDECISREQKDIKQMDGFFQRYGIKMTTYYGEDGFFSQWNRQSYFTGIESGSLSKSLILVDPDNGLEVIKSGEKHLLYTNARDLYDRMDEGSILMIYQHFPRNMTHQNYLCWRPMKIQEEVGDLPIYIDDNEIIFFFLTRDKPFGKSLGEVISKYKVCYPELRTGNIK